MSGKPAGTLKKRSAGRPRSEASRASILATAFTFLRSRPVSSISTIHIARKAGVSTATVYRWWPTKEALLLDAFLNAVNHELVLTGEKSPMVRLRKYFLQIGRFFTGDNGIVAARLLAAIQDDPKLHTEFMERICTPREIEIRAIVQEAIVLRQLPAGMEVSLFLDMILGPLLARLLFRHELIDEPFVEAVFDQAVAGTDATSCAKAQNKKM
jgi:AcrR family transcriptional regulator